MKARQYTEEQIIAVLKEGEAGAKVADLCRKYGMSDATYYNWKAKYAGMTISDLKRLKALKAENRRLKQIVAEQALDNQTLKELLPKTFNARDEETGSHVRGDRSWAKYQKVLYTGRLVTSELRLQAGSKKRYRVAREDTGVGPPKKAVWLSQDSSHATQRGAGNQP